MGLARPPWASRPARRFRSPTDLAASAQNLNAVPTTRCRQHLQSDLDEVVFRFNRRRTRHAAFRTILGIGVAITPAIYKMFITPELQR